MEYHFGVIGELIWLTHIILGIYFLYLGYKTINSQMLNQFDGVALLILGALMAMYHLHLMFLHYKNKDRTNLNSH